MPLYDYNRGTEKNGDMSLKYCEMCYRAGIFREPEMTVAQMQDFVAGLLHEEKHWPTLLANIASRQIMSLERWNDTKKRVDDLTFMS